MTKTRETRHKFLEHRVPTDPGLRPLAAEPVFIHNFHASTSKVDLISRLQISVMIEK